MVNDSYVYVELQNSDDGHLFRTATISSPTRVEIGKVLATPSGISVVCQKSELKTWKRELIEGSVLALKKKIIDAHHTIDSLEQLKSRSGLV